MPKFFRFPWASTGDKTAIPDATDVAGFVSYQQGYGNDYARDPAIDPLAKLIERDKMNQLFSDLTDNAQYWQTHTFPEYITAAQNGGVEYAYDIGVIVRYDDGGGYKNYQNEMAANTNLPTGAGWVEYKIEAIINAAAAKTTPVDADSIGIVDSEALNVLKKLTWANLKATLKTYFDTLYRASTTYPSFSAQVASQSFTATVITKIAANIVTYNDGGADYDNTTYQFTPQVAGKYRITAGMASTSGNYGCSLQVYINGAFYQKLQVFPAATVVDSVSGSVTVRMNGTTDYVEVYGSWASNNTAYGLFQAEFIEGV